MIIGCEYKFYMDVDTEIVNHGEVLSMIVFMCEAQYAFPSFIHVNILLGQESWSLDEEG